MTSFQVNPELTRY